MIPKFNINRSGPQPMLNKAFLWQVMISSGQNFNRIAPLIENLYGHSLDHYIPMVFSDAPSGQTTNIPDITGLGDEVVLAILTHEKMDVLPEFFFWFREKDIANTDDFLNFPELYTGIEKVSFDKGGLIVLSQGKGRKKLFTSQGDPLTEFVENISLGIMGLLRNSIHDEERGEGWDEFFLFDGQSLKLLDTYHYGALQKMSGEKGERFNDMYSDPYYFPEDVSSLGPRDVIEEMLPKGEKLATAFDISQVVTEQQMDEELQHNPHTEIFFRDQYADNKKLAAIVLKHKPIAYSCLSRKLQNDRNFIIEVIKKHKLYELHPFLRRKLREDIIIAALCKPFKPDGPDLPF